MSLDNWLILQSVNAWALTKREEKMTNNESFDEIRRRVKKGGHWDIVDYGTATIIVMVTFVVLLIMVSKIFGWE